MLVQFCKMHTLRLESIIIFRRLKPPKSNLDRILNQSLTDDAKKLHHSMGMAFGSVNNISHSRSSMSAHLRAILQVKSRFTSISGVRFNQTSRNGKALMIDEKECDWIAKLPVATENAKDFAAMRANPNWNRVKVEASLPLLFWQSCLGNLLKVSLVEKIT